MKDKADGVQQSSAVKPEPWTMRLRSGLLTAEASNLAEKDMALAETPSYSPRDTFPFMRLPAELRINVYNKVLVRDEPLMLHAERVPDKSDEKPASNNIGSALPPLPPPPPPPPWILYRRCAKKAVAAAVPTSSGKTSRTMRIAKTTSATRSWPPSAAGSKGATSAGMPKATMTRKLPRLHASLRRSARSSKPKKMPCWSPWACQSLSATMRT